MKKAALLVAILSSGLHVSAYAVVPTEKPNEHAQAVEVAPKINLNTANVPILIQSFKGIGKVRAQAIVHYRETNGPFKSVEDLAQVTGLGKQFVSKHLEELQQVFVVK